MQNITDNGVWMKSYDILARQIIINAKAKSISQLERNLSTNDIEKQIVDKTACYLIPYSKLNDWLGLTELTAEHFTGDGDLRHAFIMTAEAGLSAEDDSIHRQQLADMNAQAQQMSSICTSLNTEVADLREKLAQAETDHDAAKREHQDEQQRHAVTKQQLDTANELLKNTAAMVPHLPTGQELQEAHQRIDDLIDTVDRLLAGQRNHKERLTALETQAQNASNSPSVGREDDLDEDDADTPEPPVMAASVSPINAFNRILSRMRM